MLLSTKLSQKIDHLRALKGGQGSGNFGHSGRSGEVGGSTESGGDPVGWEKVPSPGDTPLFTITKNADQIRKFRSGAVVGVAISGPNKGLIFGENDVIVHEVAVYQLDPKDSIDNYVRYRVDGKGGLSTSIYQAGVTVLSDTDQQKAIENIYKANDALNSKGMLSSTPVLINMNHSGTKVFSSTLKSLLPPEVASNTCCPPGSKTRRTYLYWMRTHGENGFGLAGVHDTLDDPGFRSLGSSLKGGQGSGNFGHAGRQGEVGGSGSGGNLEDPKVRDPFDIKSKRYMESWSQSHYGALDEHRRDALLTYQGSGFRALNSNLRDSASERLPNVQELSQRLDSAMSPVHENIRVYRGTTLDSSVVSNLRPGLVFQDRGYFSTTFDRKVSDDFSEGWGSPREGRVPVVFTIDVPKGTHVAPMPMSSGGGLENPKFFCTVILRFKFILFVELGQFIRSGLRFSHDDETHDSLARGRSVVDFHSNRDSSGEHSTYPGFHTRDFESI